MIHFLFKVFEKVLDLTVEMSGMHTLLELCQLFSIVHIADFQ